jgi:hypothetical protein
MAQDMTPYSSDDDFGGFKRLTDKEATEPSKV